MPVGTQTQYFRTYGFHTYSWSTYFQPVQINNQNPITGVAASADATDPRAVQVTLTTTQPGKATIAYGTRSGAYSGRTNPVPVPSGSTVLRVTELQRNKTWYFNAQLSATIPSGAGGAPTTGGFQSGEVSFALP